MTTPRISATLSPLSSPSRLRGATVLLLPFSLFAGAVIACESDSHGGGPTPMLDGSAPSLDASEPSFDAGPSDVSAPDVTTGPQSVTVTVTGRAGPKADVRVVFHDANGAVLETKLTDTTGRAKSTGALPAMASAIFATGSQIVTWTALENGDDLAVREPDPEDSEGTLGQYEVTMPGPFDDAGMAHYDAYAGDCYGIVNGTSASIDLYKRCVRDDKTAVLMRAFGPDNQPLAYSFKKGIEVPSAGVTVPVATGPWRTTSAVTITATSSSPDERIEADLLEIADGHGYAYGPTRRVEDGSATFMTANGFADALQATIGFYSGSGARRTITKRVDPGSTIAFDTAQALPAIGEATIGGTDSRRPTISWIGSSTVGTDGGIVRVDFRAQSGAHSAWTFVVPPGATSVTAPAMPPEADSYLPEVTTGGPTAFRWPDVVFVEADTIASYAAFRSQQGALAPTGTSFVSGFPALRANGTYRTTAWMLSI